MQEKVVRRKEMNDDERKMLETYRALCERNKELLRTGAELALRAERGIREQYGLGAEPPKPAA
jgi:hypothetical protein